MTLKKLVLRVLASVLMGALVGALLLGLLGLFLAGWQGMLNGATWGALLGIFPGITLSQYIEWSYWSNFMTRLGTSLREADGDAKGQ